MKRSKKQNNLIKKIKVRFYNSEMSLLLKVNPVENEEMIKLNTIAFCSAFLSRKVGSLIQIPEYTDENCKLRT